MSKAAKAQDRHILLTLANTIEIEVCDAPAIAKLPSVYYISKETDQQICRGYRHAVLFAAMLPLVHQFYCFHTVYDAEFAVDSLQVGRDERWRIKLRQKVTLPFSFIFNKIGADYWSSVGGLADVFTGSLSRRWHNTW